jgi:hypothetical protein
MLSPDVELKEQKIDYNYDLKLSKAENNSRQITTAMKLSEEMEKNPSYPEQ